MFPETGLRNDPPPREATAGRRMTNVEESQMMLQRPLSSADNSFTLSGLGQRSPQKFCAASFRDSSLAFRDLMRRFHEGDPAHAHWDRQRSDDDSGLVDQPQEMPNCKSAEKYAGNAQAGSW